MLVEDICVRKTLSTAKKTCQTAKNQHTRLVLQTHHHSLSDSLFKKMPFLMQTVNLFLALSGWLAATKPLAMSPGPICL